MRPLTPREKRTVRIGLAAIVIYLAFFVGLHGWKSFSKRRSDYQQLVKEAQGLRQEVQPYESKALLVKKLMEDFRLDPAKLSRVSLVAEASAAIQQAALSGGVQLGPIRESPGRPSTHELASVQLEATGAVPALMALLHRLDHLGYPLMVDSVQISSPMAGQPGAIGPMGPSGPMGARTAMGPMRLPGAIAPMAPMGPPGMIKLSLTIVILDFDQWKSEVMPNA